MLNSSLVQQAQNVEKKTGIPTSIILGQAMLESGSKLNSGLAVKGNNLFGIKGTGSAGSIYLPTKEEINGQLVTVNAKFRKYQSPEESMNDYAGILQLPRYQKHLSSATSIEDFATGIKAGGYATDSEYPTKLLNVIYTNDLLKYNVNDKISFNPQAKNMVYGFGGLYDKEKPKEEQGFLPDVFSGNGVLFQGSKIIVLLLLFIIAVFLFIRAFNLNSVAEKTGSAVLDTVGTVNKGIKQINQVRKAVK